MMRRQSMEVEHGAEGSRRPLQRIAPDKGHDVRRASHHVNRIVVPCLCHSS